MNNKLKYNDYIGSVEYSAEDKIFYGKLEFIDDLVTFEADNVSALETNFKNAVEDYLKTCKQLKKEPQKVFKGTFNIRINPDLHRKACMKAKRENISLNKLIEQAIQQAVLT